jgi:hypothetical protein
VTDGGCEREAEAKVENWKDFFKCVSMTDGHYEDILAARGFPD